jgi:hypothetical protein
MGVGQIHIHVWGRVASARSVSQSVIESVARAHTRPTSSPTLTTISLFSGSAEDPEADASASTDASSRRSTSPFSRLVSALDSASDCRRCSCVGVRMCVCA